MEQMQITEIQNIQPDKILNFACEMGVRLIRNGAEMYRVEESIRRIIKSYGIDLVDVFAIPALILINIEYEEHNYSKSIRVKSTVNNLERLELLNSLSREICDTHMPLEEAEQRLQQILNRALYPQIIGYLAYAAVAFFFVLFWGGNYWDAGIGLVSGLVVKFTVNLSGKFKTNLFFANVLSGCCLAIIPLLCSYGFPAVFHLDKIIIGIIMLLVPGIAIANVMRDILAGDTLTALTKFTEVLIIGVGLTIGIAIPMALFRLLA